MVFQQGGYGSLMDPMSASVDFLSEVFVSGTIGWMMCCMFNCMPCCIISLGDDISIQDEVLYDGNLLLWFNNLQPAGCNRVSPACSFRLFSSVVYYMYSICMNDLSV